MNTLFAGRTPRVWAVLLAVVGACFFFLPGSALATPLVCSGGTIYSLGSANSVNSVYALQTNTLSNSTVTSTLVTTLPAGSSANGLGITGTGSGFYAAQGVGTSGSAKIWAYNASTAAWTSYTGTGTGSSSTNYLAGAVDPSNGIYYYGYDTVGTSSSPGTETVYGFDTTTNTAIPGIIATFPLPSGNGTGSLGGDFTFDQAGNLYVLAAQQTSTNNYTRGLGVVQNVPTTGTVNGTAKTDTTLSVVTNDNSTYNGIAFDTNGSLYLESGSIQIRSVSPNDGSLIAGPTTVGAPESAGTANDLASCTSIPTLGANANVAGRTGSGDQFTTSIAGGTIPSGTTSTSSGSATGPQSQVGPFIASPGTTYTVSETATNNDLSDYHVNYSCVDTANNNAPLASGTGASFQYTYPSTGTPSVACSFITTPLADLALSEVSSPTSVPAGGMFTYTFTAANNGPAAATNVNLTDALPSGVTIYAVYPSQGTCSGSTALSCALGTINNGANATVDVTVSVPSSASAGPITDSATLATTDETDPNTANNATSNVDTIVPAADLALTDTASSATALPGGGYSYTLTTTNTGPDSATNVTLGDSLPAGVTLQSVTPSQGTCSNSTPVSCQLGTLANGSAATVTVTVGVQNSASPGTRTDNATVSADQVDPDDDNNSASSSIAIQAAADVALSDTTSSATAVVGSQYTYTLTATNNGPDQATNVALTDTLPAGATITSTSPSQGSCSTTDGLSCQLGTIASGNSATVTVSVQAPATTQTSASDNAGLTADQIDPDPLNNATSTQITFTTTTPTTPTTTPTTPTTTPTTPTGPPATSPSQPVNQIAPSIAGTPAIGQILQASVGGWSGSDVTYRYQWLRDGVAIPGATGAEYRLTAADGTHQLSVEVVASDGTTSVAAVSQTVEVLKVDVRGCAAPSGRLTANAVGPIRLGMTRTAARRQVKSNQRLNGYTDNLCLAGGYGIRVGYTNAAMHGHGTLQSSPSSRVVFATSANPYYTLDGVRPGTRVTTVAKRLHLARPLHIGPNTWYVIPGTTTNYVLKTRGGVIQEVGVLNRTLTRTRDQQGRLLRLF